MASDTQAKVDQLYFEQYKILVNSYESIENKRTSINNFLIFMYSSIIGLYSFLGQTRISTFKAAFSIYSLAIVVSLTWAGIILKSMQTEKIKYKMVQEMERNLPVKLFAKSNEDNYMNNTKIFSPAIIELSLPIILLIVFSVDLYFNLS